MTAGPGHVVQVVRSDSFAGVEQQIVDVAGALVARGWRVSVVGGEPGRMRAALPGEVAWRPGTGVGQVLRSLHAVGRCDVVHAHMTAAELAASVLPRTARLVVTRHFAARRGTSGPARLAGRFVARRVDVQVAISEFVAAAVEGPSVVVPNGVAPSAGPLPRERVVLVLQRFDPEKDTATALRAWAAAGLAADGWRLVLHGRGREEDALRALAAGTPGVEFAGFTGTPRRALATAGVLLTTARAEPFGLSVVEAMAEGTPVVATDSGAHRETLGDLGRWFAVGDAAGAAAALRELALGDRAALGAALQRRHAEHFTLDQQAARLEQVYIP